VCEPKLVARRNGPSIRRYLTESRCPARSCDWEASVDESAIQPASTASAGRDHRASAGHSSVDSLPAAATASILHAARVSRTRCARHSRIQVISPRIGCWSQRSTVARPCLCRARRATTNGESRGGVSVGSAASITRCLRPSASSIPRHSPSRPPRPGINGGCTLRGMRHRTSSVIATPVGNAVAPLTHIARSAAIRSRTSIGTATGTMLLGRMEGAADSGPRADRGSHRGSRTSSKNPLVMMTWMRHDSTQDGDILPAQERGAHDVGVELPRRTLARTGRASYGNDWFDSKSVRPDFAGCWAGSTDRRY
jgi:hypothetical protein